MEDAAPEDLLLARRLHRDGVLAWRVLEVCLREARSWRRVQADASLARLLVERRLAGADVVERALVAVAETGRTLHRSAPLDSAASDEALDTLAAPPEPARARRPTRLGPYLVGRELGRGAMGAVFEGLHERSGRRVAIKTLRGLGLGRAGEEDLERFRREARLAARLTHPHVVQVLEAQLAEEPYYLVQELLEGGSLDVRLRREGPLPVPAALDLVAALGAALAHAHRRGVLHRDLKPQNVLFDGEGRPRLADFGLARSLAGEGRSLTVTGQILGTPAFMAPEQALGLREVDERTDVYGLGAVFYAALAGHPPARGGGLTEVLEAVCRREPPPLREVRLDVPAEVEAICARALAKDPERRYPRVEELLADLEQVGGLAPVARPPGRRRSLALLASAAAAAAALAGVALWGSERAAPGPGGQASPRTPVAPSPEPGAGAAGTPSPGPREVAGAVAPAAPELVDLARRWRLHWSVESTGAACWTSLSLLVEPRLEGSVLELAVLRARLSVVAPGGLAGSTLRFDSNPRMDEEADPAVQQATAALAGRALLLRQEDGGPVEVQGLADVRATLEEGRSGSNGPLVARELARLVEVLAPPRVGSFLTALAAALADDAPGRPWVRRAADLEGGGGARVWEGAWPVEVVVVPPKTGLQALAGRAGSSAGVVGLFNGVVNLDVIHDGQRLAVPLEDPSDRGAVAVVEVTAERSLLLDAPGGAALVELRPGLRLASDGGLDGWRRVGWEGGHGWVQSDDVLERGGPYARIEAARAIVPVRAQDGYRGRRTGYVHPGQAYPVLAEREGWVRLQHASEAAWVAADHARVLGR